MRRPLVAAILANLLLPAAAAAGTAALPAPNPWSADGPYPMSHHNPAQTDVTVVDGPTEGKQITHDEAKTVPVTWCSAPIVKKVGDHTSVIAGTPIGLTKIDATDEAFHFVNHMPYPGVDKDHSDVTPERIAKHMRYIDEKRRRKQDLRLLLHSAYMVWGFDFSLRNGGSGAYGVIDRDGYHYTFYDSTRLVKSFDGNERTAPLRPVANVGITDGLPEDEAEGVERILGIAMTYDGHLVAAAMGGIFVFDRDLRRKDHLLFPGEHVENSIAIDEGGIYLVTSQHMRRIAWDGERLSTDEADGAWTSAYDVMPEGEAIRQGAASHGSGTTPSLLGFGDDGDKLVVISDGHPEGANIVAFWRHAIPEDFQQKPGTRSRRIADQIPVGLTPTTVEASLVVYGDGVLVLNTTYPDSAPAPLSIIGNAFLAGTTREAPRGVQKFVWNAQENRFEKGWFLPEIDNTDWMPPAVSPHNGLAYVATKADDIYEYRAIDWETGAQVARWRFPDDSALWNNWGGITTLLEDGDFLLGGFFAVKRYDVGHLR